MGKTWLPNGVLKDGTLLFGPLNESPTDMGAVAEVIVGDRKLYVAYCCKELTTEQRVELQEWVEDRLTNAKN